MQKIRGIPFRYLLTGLVLSLLIGAVAAAAEESPQPDDLVGTWEGMLDAGAAKFRLVVHLRAGEEGGLEATIDSPDQGASGIPVAAVELEGDTLRLDVAVLDADYTARISADRRTLDGEWLQAGQRLPLELVLAEE